MPVVTNTIKAPGGALLTGRVSITLVGANANPIPGYVSADDYTVEAYTQTAIVAGVWSVTLVPNSVINPAGTRYKVEENVAGSTFTYFLSVPNDTGPFFVEDILDIAPTDIEGASLAGLVTLVTDQTITGTKTFRDRFIVAPQTGATTWTVVANDDGTLQLGGALTLSPTSTTLPLDVKHTGSKFGAFGVTEVARPTVTGDTAGNVALESLLVALHSLGWIVNNSSAAGGNKPYAAGYESGY